MQIKTKRRWLASVLEESTKTDVALPWTRTARKLRRIEAPKARAANG